MTSVHLATPSDIPALQEYFSRLGTETRSRFAPHGFDSECLHHILDPDHGHSCFIARETKDGPIVGYAVARLFYEPYEKDRFKGYDWTTDNVTDAFYAPSVADDRQGQGIGRLLMKETRRTLSEIGRKRMLLWGGVQATNEKALDHYRKAGFIELGRFEWNGSNLDMALDLGT